MPWKYHCMKFVVIICSYRKYFCDVQPTKLFNFVLEVVISNARIEALGINNMHRFLVFIDNSTGKVQERTLEDNWEARAWRKRIWTTKGKYRRITRKTGNKNNNRKRKSEGWHDEIIKEIEIRIVENTHHNTKTFIRYSVCMCVPEIEG